MQFFHKEINMEKLIDEMLFSLEEEERKDGEPIFPPIPHKRDSLPKRNRKAYTAQNIPLGQSPMWQQREKKE